MRTVHLLALPLLVAACSAGSAPAGVGGETPPLACGAGLPATLRISEGGFALLPRRAGVSYEGRGGVSVWEEGDALAVRAPFAGSDGDAPSIALDCGATLPLELAPLAWTKLAGSDGAPPGREYGAAWIDGDGAGSLVLAGGFHYEPQQFTPANDVFRLDFATGRWSPLNAPSFPTAPGARVAPIPSSRGVYLFGGSGSGARGELVTPPLLARLDVDGDTLRSTPVEPAGNVPGSYTGSLVLDAKRGRWLSVCGVDTRPVGEGLHCNVFAFRPGDGMRRVTTSGETPPGRTGFAYALDEASDRVLVFGGQRGPENSEIDGETWALELASEPPRWVKLSAMVPAAVKRRNGAFALDAAGRRLVLFGGTPDGRKSVPGFQVLTLDRGQERWTSRPLPEEVPSRASAFGVADGARGRLLFGFGNDDAVYQDVWALDVAGTVTPP